MVVPERATDWPKLSPLKLVLPPAVSEPFSSARSGAKRANFAEHVHRPDPASWPEHHHDRVPVDGYGITECVSLGAFQLRHLVPTSGAMTKDIGPSGFTVFAVGTHNDRGA